MFVFRCGIAMADSTISSPEPARLRAASPPTDRFYANNPGQRAPWYQRLKKRRMTLRKIALYALVLALFVFSVPVLPTFIAGAMLVAAGLGVRVWTFGHLEKNEHMITTGPYARTRNPAYLGSFLVAGGFVLAAGNPFSVAGLLVWGLGAAMLVVFMCSYLPRKYAREYSRLEQAFPQQYRLHAANVPDFFPRVTPWDSGDTRRFSWACVNANHEWWSAAAALGLALLWLA